MLRIERRPDYHEQQDRTSKRGGMPCVICGRFIVDARQRYFVHVHEGGSHVVTEEEAAQLNPAADLGDYPIGADCLRKHPEMRPYVWDTKQKMEA